MGKPRMTLNEVLTEMRSRGMSMGQATLADMIEAGKVPFATLIGYGDAGRRSFLILRADFEEWADKYLGGGEK